jgi:hypothetical protein
LQKFKENLALQRALQSQVHHAGLQPFPDSLQRLARLQGTLLGSWLKTKFLEILKNVDLKISFPFVFTPQTVRGAGIA